jgi:hypothetical protein
MNKIEKKLGNKSFIETKHEWGEHFTTKLSTPKLGGRQFPFKMFYDLGKNK